MLLIRIYSFFTLLALLSFSRAFADVSLSVAPSAEIGSEVSITLDGEAEPNAFVTIVAEGAGEGAYNSYQYIKGKNSFTLIAPPTVGSYEVRLLAALSPYKTLAASPLTLIEAKATIEAPASVSAGSEFEVKWQGPNNPQDYLAIGDASRPYITYQYSKRGSPLKFIAPDKAGDYELRYFLGSGDTLIARHPFTATSVEASIHAENTVKAGAEITIPWLGPNNPQDFISIVAKGAPEKSYNNYVYTKAGNPSVLLAPEVPGEYEIRYLSGQAYATLGAQVVQVVSVSATLSAAESAKAGTDIDVEWSGPNNPRDYITIVPANSEEGYWENYTYTRHGSPLRLRVPQKPGDYEIRYSAGQSYATLARTNIRIQPADEKPGTLLVSMAQAKPEQTAVEIILDASGSMLQQLEGKRRIDIAKSTLLNLTKNHIPEGTPFALRIFGREVGSCQSDLEIALKPLNHNSVESTIKAINAKNNAKTPIAASLKAVQEDLAGAGDEKLVILITDGEETCEGDPALEIEKLQKAGLNIRLNIVGFAIDDTQLGARFAHWARQGNGLYFAANNTAELGGAMNSALQYVYEVLNEDGTLLESGLADGKAKALLPGQYRVRLKGKPETELKVQVQSETNSYIEFD